MKKILLIAACLILTVPFIFAEVKNAEVYLLSGNEKADAEKYADAVKDYDKAISIDPQYAPAFHNKAAALVKNGKNEDAVAAYDEALKLVPNSANSLAGKGTALLNLKKYDEALDSLDKALKINPSLAGAWSDKSLVLLDMKNNEDALWAAERALEVDANYLPALTAKKKTLLAMEKYALSLLTFDSIIELTPGDAKIKQEKAEILALLGRNDEALDFANYALEIDPKYVDALVLKGTLLEKTDYNYEAIEAFDKVIKMKKVPKDKLAAAYRGRAEALKKTEQDDKAADSLKKAEEISAEIKDKAPVL